MKKPPAPGRTNPSPGWPRRDFLKTSAAAVLGLTLTRLPAMAGPFARKGFDHLVPADKKLSPDWVKSLFARGEPEVLRGSELKYAGMPVGGILAGHLYLGGDGRLWHWDIFNQYIYTAGDGDNCHYARPMIPASPLTQKFALKIGGKNFSLDRDGFADVSFRGEYPIGIVEYADAAVPLAVKLEAFSPFIPLNTDDSSLPATILQFTIRNPSAAPVEATLTGELENGVCLHHRQQAGRLRNRIVREPGLTALNCSAEKSATKPASRPDIVFEDWNKENYDGWKVEGTAFGKGPIKKSEMPSYQGDVSGDTERVVNSHATAPGDSIAAKDSATGRLISRGFTVERDFITFWVGGGRVRAGSQLGLHLWVDGQSVLTASGQDQNQMSLERFDVRAYAGKTAQLEIVDDATGGWGNVGVGKIVFTDDVGEAGPLEKLPDFGTMSLALLGESADQASADETAPFGEKLIGTINVDLHGAEAPAQCKLVVSFAGTPFANDWDVWVYPAKVATPPLADVLVTDEWNDATRLTLRDGGKVLLTMPGDEVRNYDSDPVKLGFSSIFWNTAWTGRQAPTTLGILCDPKNPALAGFPTEYFSNWQWWYLIHRAGALRLDLLPRGLKPIVRIIDDWTTARPLALVLEGRVGAGKLIVCGFDLTRNVDDPVSRQMRASLLNYMASARFAPEAGISPEQVGTLLVEPKQ